jgi:hypothetical protein
VGNCAPRERAVKHAIVNKIGEELALTCYEGHILDEAIKRWQRNHAARLLLVSIIRSAIAVG